MNEPSTAIAIRGLVKTYAGARVIDALDLDVRAGELLTLLGASGSGKTTLLRMLAGLERADAGAIHFGATAVQDGALFVPPQRRGLGMVFQSYALWPHLDVAGNLSLALREAGVERGEIQRRVSEALQTVGLSGLERRAIHQLSGGQQQRVALARALVARPRVLLMDEPLSNLDVGLREQLRDEIRALQQRLGITTVFVTHDQTEALAMSDRIALLHQGRLVELGPPEQVYGAPQSAYAARFLGQANVLQARPAAGGNWRVGQVELTLPAAAALPAGPVQLMIRPEALRWAEGGEAVNAVAVKLRGAQMLGAMRQYHLWAPALGCELLMLEPSDQLARAGDGLRLTLPPAALRVLPAA